MKKAMNVGIVGLGDISGIYLQNIVERYHQLKVVAVCDILYERALAVKEKYGIPAAYQNVEDLVNDSAVEIVLNLTRPVDHFNVTMAALHAGKHVYTEKPLGVSFEETAIFGDYLNDVSMMQSGYYSYAMKNAHPDIKALSRFETKLTNEEDGVIETLIELFGLGGKGL